MRRLALILAIAFPAATLGGCASEQASGISAARLAAGLDSVVLRPAQIGAAYQSKVRLYGRSLAVPTLTMCGRQFASEGLRRERLQVNFTAPGRLEVSNEVVRYAAGGAKQAMQEVADAAAHCPPVPRFAEEWVSIQRETAAGAPQGAIALKVTEASVSGVGQRLWSRGAAVFIRRGDLLSGVYTYGPQSAALRLAARLGRVSATNLGHS